MPGISLQHPRIFVGTSGWAYTTWKPGFYPEGTPAKNFLRFYASQLNTVEVNHTFRKLPTSEVVAKWLAEAPEGFRFSFKAPQSITHFRRLVDCAAHLEEFYRLLEPVATAGKLGLVLFQLPPNFKAHLEKLETFLSLPAFQTPGAPPVAFEYRHESWFTPEAAAILSRHNAALCIAETEDLQTPEIHTATTHTCFRLRRTGGYKPREITAFAARFLELAKTRDVYVHFKHEDEPTGALNALALRRALARLAPSAAAP